MKEPTVPEPVTMDRILGWRSEQLVFNKKSLPVIFGELERRFDISIHLEAEDMEGETLTTIYANPMSVETVLDDICRVKGLRYTQTVSGYRIHK